MPPRHSARREFILLLKQKPEKFTRTEQISKMRP